MLVSQLCQIKDTIEHGRVIVATQKIQPGPLGLVVFREDALLAIPTTRTPEDLSGPVPDILEAGPQLWTDWFYYSQKSEEVKSRILQMYVEMDCAPAVVLKQYLERHKKTRDEEKSQDVAPDDSILNNIEEFVRFAMVIRFNTVELCPPSDDGTGPGYDYGHGLFENACKMSHSCKPNCIWKTTQDGKAKEIRAIRTIEKGEELTVDYVGNVLGPIPERREELLVTKGFLCNCDRCSAQDGDDTRRFMCSQSPTTGCPGVHFLDQPLLTSEPTLLQCTHCGVQPPDSYTFTALKKEEQLTTEIQEVDEAADELGIENLSSRIEQLSPPHDLHRLAEKCYGLQGELYSKLGDHRASAQAFAKQINCRIAILGDDFKSQQTAFLCEKLGDELCHVNVEEAEEAYRRSVRSLQVMRGGVQDPYSKCALNKLLAIQSRLVSDGDLLPHQKDFDGISKLPGGPPRTDCPCALCGNPGKATNLSGEHLVFCCDDHRQLHTTRVHELAIEEEK
eukprot:CAMPEP_0117014022 /NCGR_PEP_ID=MMETSP0472-20121206/11458_1 /TAXON_ID=693140 ORGANISM="Tiarina fusus, Strain LIS" /NCGR_SAMPLE_ID=MMETSP0472 /ASSEMBLY_ACC=CAM_ASM_000603 /LENGTH=505 /DNA_ID=CAMNT_0004717487 /DNA_START=90 /DNA_END=1604 /DNA_ORIENTATION=+